MFLKRIELNGFKSFADKTKVIIEEGITAVVGPNGSGKSNISDAIKWVLGEQSAKSLRGSKMEDIIFSGSESRSALGYAEVNLIFDNTQNFLPIEYNEVSVKRRLFRTGESEYYINKKNCRLKDIKELFLDTGVGKDGYSVIGQGRVEDILSTKSEIRRNVFEEAAGIVKFKVRKEEAQRKLNRTTDNIDRVNDIIYELEQRLEPLEKQSVKAKEYIEHRNNLKKFEINFLVREYEKYKSQNEQLISQINDIEKLKTKIYNKRDSFECDFSTERNLISEIEEKLINFEAQKDEKTIEYEKLINSINVLEQKVNILDKNIKNYDLEINELISRKDELEYFNKDINTKREYTVSNLTNFKNDISKYENKFNNFKELVDNSYKSIESQKDHLYDSYNNINDLNNKKNTIESLKRNLEDRLKQLNEEIINNTKEVDNKTKKISNLISIKNKAEIKIKDLEKLINSYKNNYNNCDNNLKVKELKLKELTGEIHKNNSKLNILQNMEQYYEGYYKSVQTLMNDKKNKKVFEKSIIGTTADLIKTNKKYEIAIETALGNSIQNVIVKSENDASKIIDYLKANKIGRITFLPLDSVKERSLRYDEKFILNEKGVIGTADTLVDNVFQYNNIIKHLLGRVLVVDNLKNGFNAAKKLGYSIRIVSITGEVLNPGGAVTGGFLSYRNQNFLGRKRQIEELKEKLINNKKEELKINQEVEYFLKEKDTIDKTISEVLEKINNETRNITTFATEIRMNEEDLNKTNERIKKYENEKKYLLLDIKEHVEKIDLIEEKILNIKDNITNAEKKLEEVSENSQKNKNEFENINEQITKLKLQINTTEQDIKLYDEKINNNTNEIRRIDNSIKVKNDNIENIKGEIAEANNNITNFNANEKKLKHEKEILDARCNKLKHEKDELQSKVFSNQEELNEINKKITELLDDENSLKVKTERYKTKIEDISSKLWDDYEMNYAMALEYKDLSISYTRVSREVSTLKKKIKELGDVNVHAIEEYSEVKNRYEFLTKQRKDLSDAEIELSKVIKELEKNMKEKFLSEFNKIKIKFNEVFKYLFNGGKSDVFFENEEDILNSNIEIVAQPPGKKLNKITLLSGGEKALTAIALLFAILKTKPTPFCILDEIEAALDDANVYRFADFLKHFSSKTQFLIITHRKGTMEYVDTLYGTTMEEKGVTKLVSLKLSDIDFIDD